MGTGLPALYRAPGPIQGPYGCLIEHTALLIELTALSLGPFPLPPRRGTIPHPHRTPVPSHRRQSRGRGRRGALGGWRKQRVRRGSCWNCPENVSLSVGKPMLEMWTGGNQRSQSSQDQWVPAGQRVFRTEWEWKDGIVENIHNISLPYCVFFLTICFSLTLWFIVVLLFCLAAALLGVDVCF